MDPRESWRALQAHLTVARTSFEAGDRAKAIEAIEAALAIDPNFLAAHSLREQLLDPPAVQPPADMPPAPIAEPQPPAQPLVSEERYASFEQRAKRRRVDRRIDAARTAIARARTREASAALDEVMELDPNTPEIAELVGQLRELQRKEARPRLALPGRWVAAAAAFGGVVFFASYLQESTSLGSRSTIAVGPLVAPATPLSVPVVAAEPDAPTLAAALPDRSAPVATAGASSADRQPVSLEPPRLAAVERPEPIALPVDRPIRTIDTRAFDARPVEPPVVTPPPAPMRAALETGGPTAPPAAPPAALPPAAAPVVNATAVMAPAARDDEQMVKAALQRYRTAYDGLDARSARAVYPAVNEAALSRAFNGLESQSLTFDACDIQVRGEAAAATCHGSARYVPKIGSREPRVEPRVWSFALRKSGGDWKIDSARAER